MLFTTDDTIAAIATPAGTGGISIVKISGPDALKIGESLFRGSIPISENIRKLVLGEIVDPETGRTLDQCLAVYMEAPQTYTGQDVVEFQTHGGPAVVNRILDLCQRRGSRSAENGEFTFRAFMNSKLTLNQAESVHTLIQSHSVEGVELSAAMLGPYFGDQVRDISAKARQFLGRITLEIDFIEDEVDDFFSELKTSISSYLIQPLEGLIEKARPVELWSEGSTVAIAGPVNAGKSTLMNTLLAKERCLVSDTPGTTRDYVQDFLLINGLPVRITDTAGLRPTGEEEYEALEAAGIRLTERILEEADLVIFVLAVDQTFDPGLIHHTIGRLEKPAILGLNKIDLIRDGGNTPDISAFPEDIRPVLISAKHNIGIQDLKTAIIEALTNGLPGGPGTLAVNKRQRAALDGALDAFYEARKGLSQGLDMELIAIDLSRGLDCLGRIIGETTSEDVLQQIFDRFCVGK